MHEIEPFYGWQALYKVEEDEQSPYFGKEYSEFKYTETIYNYYIHPQWDSIDSETLFTKIIYTDYEVGYAFIELFGEWNDALNNDIELLIVNLLDFLTQAGVDKIILIGSNVLNFHEGEMDYYADFIDNLEDGWVKCILFQDHVISEMKKSGVFNYFQLESDNFQNWRTYLPNRLFELMSQ